MGVLAICIKRGCHTVKMSKENRGCPWRIYYPDFSYEGDPEFAPGEGALAIVHWDDTTDYRIMHGGGPYFGHGFYWWQDEQWFIGDYSGLHMYLAKPGWKKVIFGVTVTATEWRELLARIEEHFGPKSSFWPRERRAG